MRGGRWVLLVGIVLLSGVFAYLNGGERISLNFGFTVLYRISLVGVVFGAFVLGMVTMFLIGLRNDLRLRRELRRRGLFDDAPLRHDEPHSTYWSPPAGHD